MGERYLLCSMALCLMLYGACSGASASRQEAILAYCEAATFYDTGNLEGTIAAAAASLAEDGTFYPALLIMGKASYLKDDDEAAITALRRAVRVSPRAGEAALWLARAYRAAGDVASAKRYCELALSGDSADVAALRLASSLAFDAGEESAAIAFLDRAVAASGEAGLAFLDRAALRWAAGDAAGAQADIEAATSTLPVGSASREAASALGDSVRAARR